MSTMEPIPGSRTVLDDIIAAKRRELAELKAAGYFAAMRRRLVSQAQGRDFTRALRPTIPRHAPPHSPAAAFRPALGKLSPRPMPEAGGGAPAQCHGLAGEVRVIAEIKKASPSRGVMNAALDPVAQARTYAESGASAISVLTERSYFHGDPSHLAAVREAVGLPLLRKDFIIDPDQVFESRALGADAILLIVAALSDAALRVLLDLAGELGLECLVEVHTEEELRRALDAGARLIGINNRDLRTFATDLAVTERLAPLVPPECTLVAESGVFTRADVERLGRAGAHAVLVGEALVRAEDPGALLRQLTGVPGSA